MSNYYLLDTGKDMLPYARLVEGELIKDGHHVVKYLTDVDNLLCIEEITEDAFLDHYANKNTNEK